jgi:prophage DNA circulation protein
MSGIASSLVGRAVNPVMAQFSDQVTAAAADATATYNVVYGLAAPAGESYGRYFVGTDPLVDYQDAATDVPNLIAQGVTLRASVASALATASVAIEGDPGTFAASIIAVTEALRAACANPADAVRLLGDLAGFAPQINFAAGDATGTAMTTLAQNAAALMRRAAGISLARASATYTPTSQQDAATVLDQIGESLGELATAAADVFDDNAYSVLLSLRTAVYADLNTRGASLAPVVTRTMPIPLPSLVVAYRLYQDASRADELTARNDPPNPLFFPLQIEALAE